MSFHPEHSSNMANFHIPRSGSEYYGDDVGVMEEGKFQIFNSCQYYTQATFDILVSGKKLENNFGVLHLNANSLRNKEETLCLFLRSIKWKFVCLCFTSTNFENEAEATMYSIPGYKLGNFTLRRKRKGGTAIFVREDVPFRKNDLKFNSIEACSCDVEHENGSVTVICGYNTNFGRSADFCDESDTLFEELMRKNRKKVIFAGDMNLNLINFGEDDNVSEYVYLMDKYNMRSLVDKPTHIPKEHNRNFLKSSLIDHIFTNICTESYTGIIDPDISDHHACFTIFTELDASFHLDRERYVRNWAGFEKRAFLDDLNSMMSQDLMDFERFHQGVQLLFNKHVPLRKLNRKEQRSKPWCTRGILQSHLTKGKLLKRARRTKQPGDWQKYRKFSNKFSKLIKAAKKRYIQEKLLKYNKSCRKTWQFINEILNRKRKDLPIPRKLLKDNRVINDPKEMAQVFNQFFAEVGQNLADEIPAHRRSSLLDTMNYDVRFPTSKFNGCTAQEIASIISKMNERKVGGFDEIPVKLLKLVSSEVSPILARFINEALSTGKYPDSLKIAKIIPIFKKGNREEATCYRPISLLSVINKIFERIIYHRLNDHFRNNDLFYEKQYGFRSGRSTMHALSEVVQYIREAGDCKENVCSVFVDLSKAFDTVTHEILTEKLKAYGISSTALSLIKDYLTNRKQCVQLGRHCSELVNVNCGVPQGSVLGPLLFIIYVNDIERAITNCGKIITFADDTAILFKHEKLGMLKRNVEKQLKHLRNWFEINKLTLNADKTNYLLTETKAVNREDKVNFAIKIQNQEIQRVNSLRYLGVIVDDQLNWREQIAFVRNKIKANIAMLYKIGSFIDINHRKMLYNAFILPHINYCLPIWGIGYISHYRKLVTAQNTAVRSLVFAKTRGTQLDSLYNKLSLLNFDKLVYYNVAICIWRIKHSQAPEYLCRLFTPVDSVHHHATRRAVTGAIYTVNVNTCRSLFAISQSWARIWDKINPDIRKLQQISNFKTKCKAFLLESNYSTLNAPRFGYASSQYYRDYEFY